MASLLGRGTAVARRALAFVVLLGLGICLRQAKAGQTFIKDLASDGGVLVKATAAHPFDGSFFLLGVFSGPSLQLPGLPAVPSAGGTSGTPFVAKLGADGSWRWAGQLTAADGTPSINPRSLAVSRNHVVVVGEGSRGVRWTGGHAGGTATQAANDSLSDTPFVTKLDLEGRHIWTALAANREANANALGVDVAIDADNNVVICGTFRSVHIDEPVGKPGLWFGDNHALRARDGSGTGGNSSDWDETTRDGFVAKLDSGGQWKWVATGGSQEDRLDGFMAISVDDAGNVYVIGNGQDGPNDKPSAGCRNGVLIHAFSTPTQWRQDRMGTAAIGIGLPTQNVTTYVAKLGSGANEGRWLGYMALGGRPEFGAGVPNSCEPWNAKQWNARDVLWVKGKVYALHYDVSGTSLALARLTADLKDLEKIATVNGNGYDDAVSNSSISADQEGNLFLVGHFGAPQADFTPSTGGSGIEMVTSVGRSIFAGMLSSTESALQWQWVRKAEGVTPSFETSMGAVDPATGRLFIAGTFHDGTLRLGEQSTQSSLPATAAQGAANRTYIATIFRTGEFMEQIPFEMITQFGGSRAFPPPGAQNFLKGTTINASVPAVLYENAQGGEVDANNPDAIRDLAVVRHICTGFEVVDTAVTGNTASFSLTVVEDTRLRFLWKTEYALVISNNLENVSKGLTSTAVGDPSPVVQKHWIQEGTITTAFIDGVIPSPDSNEVGTRYRSTGYYATGVVSTNANGSGTFIAWQSVQTRQQVPQFLMSGAASIEYRWAKENRIQVSAIPADLGNAPRVLVGGQVVRTGTGEFWFADGTALRLEAPEKPTTPVGYQLKGFTGGFGDVVAVTGDGEGKGTGTRFVLIPALHKGSLITWDYSDRVYKGKVLVGQPIVFGPGGTFTGAEEIPAAAGIDSASAPVATTLISGAPAGSLFEDMRIWDDFADRLYALRPGVFVLEWRRVSGSSDTRNILTEITAEFAPTNHYTHVSGTPPVLLDSDKTNSVAFVAMKYSESEAQVNDAGEFTSSGSGRSVLLFSERPDGSAANGDLTRERLRIRVVGTRHWNDGLINAPATIGTEVKSALHDAAIPHNGYIKFELGRYNAELYSRATMEGPIFPVNKVYTGSATNQFVVVWYRRTEGLDWPWQAVQYAPEWPVTDNRIVVASRLGSEGTDKQDRPQVVFDPERYSNVKVYHQPDISRPGYNPNEEHALVVPSFLYGTSPLPPPAVFALRNNLNVLSTDSHYTSDPYVLVQYDDATTQQPGMAVYRVELQDQAVPVRVLEFLAGQTTNGASVSVVAPNVLEFGMPGHGLRSDEMIDLESNGNLIGAPSGAYRVIRLTDARFRLSTGTNGVPINVSGIVVTNAERRVVVSRKHPYVFQYPMLAGEPVIAPYPLQDIIGPTPCEGTLGSDVDATRKTYWVDHKGQPWAVSGDVDATADLRMDYRYPLLPQFWHPRLAPGACVPYVGTNQPVAVLYNVAWPGVVPVLKAGETLTHAGGEIRRDDANQPGLPGVLGWAAGQIVYDDANKSMDLTHTVDKYLARLAAPLEPVSVDLPLRSVPQTLQPAGGKVSVSGVRWFFTDLDASLQARVFYDSVSQKLVVRGLSDGMALGDPNLTAAPGSIPVLQPNILTTRDTNQLSALSPDTNWLGAVKSLYLVSRDPRQVTAGKYGVGLEPVPGETGRVRPATQFGPGLALLANPDLLSGAVPEGYVTLAENNHESLGAAPVKLHIVKMVSRPMFRGAIKTINPPNPFDEKVTLRHSGDFGANADSLVFDWQFRPDDGAVVPPPDSAPEGTWKPFADSTGRNGQGMQEINLAGAGAVTLTDNRFFVRWRHAGSSVWSEWAGAANSRPPNLAANERPQDTYVPQLAEGWVKRVIAGVNPFDARIQDFRANDAPATYASMVRQAGAPYRGPVALNPDKDVIENTGLIELYTTVLERAKDLSIDLGTPISTPGVNNAILLAASRIADLYLMLGNEAYTDAQDPTIGFGTGSSEYGSLAPTIFTFQNQVPSLLDEELALLRGRAEEGAYPAHNRLLWNFTRAEGEAAYALSYNITDQNGDGFINETDGRILYPQGHGDAWGHYLSALRGYYDLLRHPAYNWQSRSENLQIDGVVVAVDYLDERKFAQVAAARAKAGAEIVNLTYRSRYTENPDGQWQGYQDSDANRAWGVSEWARRAGCAALFDWITANSILPANDATHTGIEKVDRTTVTEITQIAAQAREIRRQMDNANTGLNPVGLTTDVVPFDIDPIGFDPSTGTRSMHFDQVYERALKALQNALDVFNHANQINNMLRQAAVSADQFASDAEDQDRDFKNRMIELFGTPYEGTIGSGRAYPAGYDGPDLYLHMYVDVTGLKDIPEPAESFTAFFTALPGGKLLSEETPGGGGKSIKEVFSHYFPDDTTATLEDSTNTDFSGVLKMSLPRTASGYSFQAPAAWGQRRSVGELQQVLSELVQAEAELQLALAAYDGVIGDASDLVDLLRAHGQLATDTVDVLQYGRSVVGGIQAAILAADGAAAVLAEGAATAEDIGRAVAEAFPRSAGVAVDVTSGARSAAMATAVPAEKAFLSAGFVAERTAHFLEGSKEMVAIQESIEIADSDFKYAIQEQLKELKSLLGDEGVKRIEVFRQRETVRQISARYRSLLESGTRLMEEREAANKAVGGAVQALRYQDFTFRIARNDALSKYRAAFDLATRYAYLAAKAYDYETNLDPADPASAQPLMTEILKARTLGAVENGEPRLGSGGLADALATMKVNFEVLRTQMGFNNPQGESGQFSLRHELFRLKGAESAAKWRQELEKHRVADLWKVPEFRRYCRPFAPESAGAQPGMVIPFGSQVIFGKNFFGWPLGPGDSAYDPTLFATKIRSVGVWFDGYAGEGLGSTPRVYLVPAGMDIMYTPSSSEFATREWNVVDQRIPVPLPVNQASFQNPSWIPVRDSVNGPMAEIRRFSSFRAYHDSGFKPEEMTFDSRVVGRSVWNTRWMLIIPGGTFLADQTEGLDTFIYGPKSADGPATDSRGARRSGNGISDIKLSFQTYAISGN